MRFRDVARERVHREVRDLAGVHEDTYLAPSRNSIDLLNALEGGGEALKVAKALKIAVNGIAPRARATARYCICYLHDDRLRRLIRILLMVRLHRENDAFIDSEFLQNATPYLNMRALHLVVNRFPMS